MESTGEGTYKITGTFSLHGVTKEITIQAEKTGKGKGPEGKTRIGFLSKFTINRSDYGMTKYVDSGMVGDEIKIIISLEGVKT